MQCNYQLTVEQGQYNFLADGKSVAVVKPGAFLNNYGAVVIINGAAITYSVITQDPSVDPSVLISELLSTFRTTNVEFTLVARGHIESRICGAVAILVIGNVSISGLWLHPTASGIDMVVTSNPDAYYSVVLLHSKLIDVPQPKILLNDTINLRHVFGKLTIKTS